jgi:hypothetical protein
MKRVFHIAFLSVFLFLAATPWIVIHTCGGGTDVDLMSASAEDPCGCRDEADAAPCCSIEVRSFHFDDARPVLPAVPDAGPACAHHSFFVFDVTPDGDPRHAPAITCFHPPGQPPLQILHSSLLV